MPNFLWDAAVEIIFLQNCKIWKKYELLGNGTGAIFGLVISTLTPCDDCGAKNTIARNKSPNGI